jgi:hypothetical protein
MYPKAALRASFSEPDPKPEPERKIGAMEIIPPVSFFESAQDDGLDF